MSSELERKVNDLLAAKNANGVEENSVRIFNNQVQDELGFYSVTGEVMNQSGQNVSWVMITATFYDANGQTVDTKYGFATDFNQVIEPGELADFTTQTTKKDFDHYSLDLSWESGEVAGEISVCEAEETCEFEALRVMVEASASAETGPN